MTNFFFFFFFVVHVLRAFVALFPRPSFLCYHCRCRRRRRRSRSRLHARCCGCSHFCRAGLFLLAPSWHYTTLSRTTLCTCALFRAHTLDSLDVTAHNSLRMARYLLLPSATAFWTSLSTSRTMPSLGSPDPPKAAKTARSTYLPTMSTSTLTLAPTGLFASVILDWVCAMSMTLSVCAASSTCVSVSDAPSRVM